LECDYAASAIRQTKRSRTSRSTEVRSGGSYISQNDLRVHFGLGKAEKAEILEIRWPSGQIDTLKDVKANQLIYVKEAEGIVRSVRFDDKEKEKGKAKA
jgi:hypothetical protein